MPKVLQWISYLFPLRYYLVIIRSLMLKGVGVARLCKQKSWPWRFLGWRIMTVAALRFRKRLD